jgi:hypothetical protein
MSRKWVAAGVVFAAAALLTAGSAPADEPKKNPKRTLEEIKEMMTKAHKGAKSPLARTGTELKRDKPDWGQLAKDAKVFAEMAAALDESGHYGRGGYLKSAAAFGKAAGAKDAKAATEAFASLKQSCGACHYGVPK